MSSEGLAQRWAKRTLDLAATFIAIVALLFHVDQMYLMAAALFLLPRTSWLIGWAGSGGVRCERSLPPLCGVGQTVPVTLTVTNTGRLSKRYLRAADRLPRRLRPVGERAPLILHLRPGESREVTYFLEPERRGHYLVGPALVETTDPLGFYVFPQRAGATSEVAAHPTPLPLRRVFFEGAGAPGWQSRSSAQTRGLNTEFQGVREYQPGDELRHVHWRTTARTGTLSVAEYERGASRDAVIALDLSRSAYADTGEDREGALEYAVLLAASLSDFLLRRGYAVRLLTPAGDGAVGPPARSPQESRILGTLVSVEADSPLTLAETLAHSRLPLSPGTALVYITPDAGDPPLAAALQGWAARGAQVYGLALQADSFRPVPHGRSAPPGQPLPDWARPVRQGDDLVRILEG